MEFHLSDQTISNLIPMCSCGPVDAELLSTTLPNLIQTSFADYEPETCKFFLLHGYDRNLMLW